MSWKELARSLPYGGKRKVECCGTVPSTYVNNSTKGISIGPCFRCGHREWEAHGPISAAQLLLWRKADTDLRGMRKPSSTAPVSEWPTDVLVWLGKAGVSIDAALKLGVQYDAASNRVLLPITEDGVKQGFLARSVRAEKNVPKYIASINARGRNWLGGTGPVLVIVEDILSAIRVTDAGYRCLAAQGTSFSQEMLTRAMVGITAAVSWLDPDAAGIAAHRKLRKAFSLWDQPLYRVLSERDPKAHSKQEIHTYIKEAML